MIFSYFQAVGETVLGKQQFDGLIPVYLNDGENYDLAETAQLFVCTHGKCDECMCIYLHSFLATLATF